MGWVYMRIAGFVWHWNGCAFVLLWLRVGVLVYGYGWDGAGAGAGYGIYIQRRSGLDGSVYLDSECKKRV